MADHTSGGSSYTEEQRRRVIALLQGCQGPYNWTSTSHIATACEIKERALRQLLSDLDGTMVDGWPFCLAFEEGSARLWLSTDRAQAEAYTRRLRHQINSMMTRVSRREGCYGALGEPQGVLGL